MKRAKKESSNVRQPNCPTAWMNSSVLSQDESRNPFDGSDELYFRNSQPETKGQTMLVVHGSLFKLYILGKAEGERQK